MQGCECLENPEREALIIIDDTMYSLPKNEEMLRIHNKFLTIQIRQFVIFINRTGRVAQSVGHPTRKSGVLGSIPGLATYFRFSFRFFKKGSCQLLAKVCARSTG